MANNKSQEMSIQTVVVVILILIVLVVVIAFTVPQLTGIFGGLAGVTNETASQLPVNIDLAPKACYGKTISTPGSPGCTVGDTTACPRNCQGLCNLVNEFDCTTRTNNTANYFCCKWANVS